MIGRFLGRAADIFRKQGLQGLAIAVVHKIRNTFEFLRYDQFLRGLAMKDRSLQVKDIRKLGFEYTPLISVILPVYNTPGEWLKKCIRSVRGQVYSNWELCIVDGGSDSPVTRVVLEYFRARDSRIKVKLLGKNLGIAGNSNESLAMATGDYVTFLDHDDVLAQDALYEVARELNTPQRPDFIYSDEDKLTNRGRRHNPHFKPDWSPDTFLSYNYITHLAAIRRELVTDAGGFRAGFEGAQDYDLFLRVTERTSNIRHIPKILYHWRMSPQSAAESEHAKPYAVESGRKALDEALKRRGIAGSVEPGTFYGSYRIRYEIHGKPRVAIIIPTRNHGAVLKRCIDSIIEKTEYDNYELIIVDNGSDERDTIEYLDKLNGAGTARVLKFDEPFNFSRINNFAASRTEANLLLFLNNDIEVISRGWLGEMVSHTVRPGAGITGAMLYYPNNRVQHAGVIIGISGLAGHAHKNLIRGRIGYHGRAAIVQNLSAVTAACLMIKKTVFDSVGGFDEKYAVAFGDVDLCMKVRKQGALVIFTPFAELYHHESYSRGYEDSPEKVRRFHGEVSIFLKKWQAEVDAGDPYYNPNLTLDREDFTWG